MSAYLGIEIGGTKLQLGVGNADGPPLDELVRLDVIRSEGAAGILSSIEQAGQELCQRHSVEAVGIGFGGPLDASAGIVTCSHQVDGWEQFPLKSWCEEKLSIPAMLENDCNLASLAEARFGAGKGHGRVFYLTVGTGIGGGLVVDGELAGRGRPAIAEIGHLRPGVEAGSPEQTVEARASGLGIEQRTRELMAAMSSQEVSISILLGHCHGDPDQLTTREIALAALAGSQLARQVIADAVETLGWAMAQVVTLIAPDIVVVGGGVSMMDKSLFLEPLGQQLERFVFPPLQGSYQVAPPQLGEDVVVHGALALAAGYESWSSLGRG